MQKILLCDDTIESFLSAVFLSYADKEKEVAEIITEKIYQPTIDTEIVKVNIDLSHFERVKNCLIKKGGYLVYNDIVDAIKSGEKYKGAIVLKFIKKLIKEGKEVVYQLNDPVVYAFEKLYRAVRFETHRFKGILRFQETTSGIYYGQISPKHNIVEKLMPHFCDRCHEMDFIIHDVKRNIMGIYSSRDKKYQVVNYNGCVFLELSKEETEIKKLFKDYYNTVNIKERKNLKQQNNYLPKAYRQNMDEFK